MDGLHANQSSSGAKRAGYGSGPLANNVSLFRKRRLAFAGIITGDRQLTSYSFGKFDFLPDERRLKKAGKEIPLGARAFDLLIFLVENRHRVVTKAEMLDAVWPDIAVEESNLTVQVSALRKVLGADALATIPGRGYQFVLAESAAEAKGPDSKSKPGSSILVLPFANTSNDPDQEYFSDGIAEDIITDLCKVRALSVIARNTAFTYKGRAVDVAEIAGRLGVSHVVEGSVRKAGNRLRINAQLVDGATDHPVWADRYDRDLTDIFALQDEITEAIVAALKVRLVPDERAAILARPTDNPKAYEIYLQARYHRAQLGVPNIQIAARLAQQALEIDPKLDLAWALLSHTQAQLYLLGLTSDNGLAAAERALALSPNLVEALAAKGRVLIGLGRLEEAVAILERGLVRAPEPLEVLPYYARALMRMERFEDAAAAYERICDLDPEYIWPAMFLETCYKAAGRPEKAQQALREALVRADRALDRNPADAYSMMSKFLCHARLGEAEQAKHFANQVKAMSPDDPMVDYNIGCALALLGETETALNFLEQGLKRANSVEFVKVLKQDVDLDSLRREPRFQKIVSEVEARALASSAK